ncbi:MAG: membrane protein insertion efficiency factor YidD [Sphaerochaeta sp.]|jgi:putative membrane protein insertion efficiency factor|nr:membrane protein insertion efficiency factor YidD [Sphaerochaeta sp.]MCH3919315.1 membrane protein insertion efficiency factor YidD [Sphaerochaeta sp.]MCI2045729.1 membrane protein insertion efficiency factor YidD [Sphaerochaeta sp.]MCI2076728.1 membrane protein insertion efficiency factor YidD [Sphaerochaeta sp.]MCI2097270.1 membrane protein insertion efficiency factor YidD [Sphaerochaeta sp.]
MRILRELFLLPVHLYRTVLAPLFSHGVCLYQPTCSTYFLTAVRRFGIGKGTIMGLARVFRCNRWFMGGPDPVPETWSWKQIKEGYTIFKRR